VTNRTYRITEIVGTSPTSIEDAVRNGVTRAAETLRHLDWLEVTEIRGQIVDGDVQHWQVGVKIGFRLEDSCPGATGRSAGLTDGAHVEVGHPQRRHRHAREVVAPLAW